MSTTSIQYITELINTKFAMTHVSTTNFPTRNNFQTKYKVTYSLDKDTTSFRAATYHQDSKEELVNKADNDMVMVRIEVRPFH